MNPFIGAFLGGFTAWAVNLLLHKWQMGKALKVFQASAPIKVKKERKPRTKKAILAGKHGAGEMVNVEEHVSDAIGILGETRKQLTERDA